MVIGVDIRMLARGVRAGVQEYLINLLGQLPLKDPNINYRLFYNGLRKVKLDFPWLDFSNIRVYDFIFPSRLIDFSTKIFNRPRFDKMMGGIDLFVSPHFFSAPLSRGVKKVTTFHDLSFEREPRFFSFRQRLWHRTVRAKKAAQTSFKLIAVSRSTKEDLINLYKIKPDKIEVIYSGIDPKLRILSKEELILERLRLKGKYNLPDNFILYLGTIEPRKNIIGIIKAFNLLKKKSGFDEFHLVLAGSWGWLFDETLKIWRSSPFCDSIKFLGPIPAQDRVGLYNLARVFIYPSFFEGFGFPPLEAMACGTPTVVSTSSSLPEVVGGAAVLVDPYKIEEIYEALKLILGDCRLYRHLRLEGLKRAKQFSWEKCAQKTLAVLKSC
ncbi:MAG: glycosyltransferase family 1 protein [bacterium]|nr:glycosyltransferase family 1 protein [bacterium]